MVYRSVRAQPPRGSTAWGAQQFRRLLDDEERIAAERERLRALGWRPPQSTAGPYSDEPTFGDGRDAYADLVEQGLVARRAVDDEARRHVATAHVPERPATDASRCDASVTLPLLWSEMGDFFDWLMSAHAYPDKVPGRWACNAKCYSLPTSCPPADCQPTYGYGVGNSLQEAAGNAQRIARNATPPGCRTKHYGAKCISPKGDRVNVKAP